MAKNNNCDLEITSNSKTIKINNRGDEISINIDDRVEMNKIINMVMNFKEQTSKHLENPDLDSLNKLCDDTEKELKEFFGDDILIKIFNIEHPSLRLFVEFFCKLFKIISKFSDEKNEQTVKNIESIYGEKYINRLESN